MTIQDRQQLNWQAVGLLLGFMLQLGAVIWFESNQRSQIIELSERVARVEQQRSSDAQVLSGVQSSISKVSGQLEILTTLILDGGKPFGHSK